MDRVEASYGDDAAEDVLGGMDEALDLEWTIPGPGADPGARVVSLVMIHIGDAPHHGEIFRDDGQTYRDAHPEMFASPRSHEAILQDYAGMKVDYYFAEVKTMGGKGAVMTRKMSKLFETAYNSVSNRHRKFTVVSLARFSPKSLFSMVMEQLTMSITRSQR